MHRGGPTWTRLCADLQKQEGQQWILEDEFRLKWLNMFLEGPGFTGVWVSGVSTDCTVCLQGLLMPFSFLLGLTAEVGKMDGIHTLLQNPTHSLDTQLCQGEDSRQPGRRGGAGGECATAEGIHVVEESEDHHQLYYC